MAQHLLPKWTLNCPCEVPAYTRLYHCRMDGQIPPDPDWFAFDIEMSYGIMGSTRNSHMLTYQSLKPVSCIYFDGMSAALAGTGQLDSQMVFPLWQYYRTSTRRSRQTGQSHIRRAWKSPRSVRMGPRQWFGRTWLGSRSHGENERRLRSDIVQLQQAQY